MIPQTIRATLVPVLLALGLSGCGGGGSGGGSTPAANNPPLADAGADQVVGAQQLVTLTGSGSDSDGAVVAYAWSQLAGTPVSLSGADTAVAGFTAPAASVSETLSFQLTVTDDDGASASDSLTVTVNPVISAALPDFGPDPAQCPATQADLGAGVIHVCDCQSGADAACVAGNDANAGTAAAPRQSIVAAMSAFNAGGQVAFCRGGAWSSPSTLALNAANCSSAAPCRVQDYGDAALARPLIQQNAPGNTNGFQIAPGSDLAAWQGVRVYNLHLSKQAQDGQGFGVFLFRNVSDIELRCLEVNGFGVGVHVNSNGLSNTDITLSDSFIHDNGGQGWLGGVTRTLVERNHFDNNGWLNASILLHNVYLSGIGADTLVRGNWLTRSAVDANGQCVGASLIAHNGISTNLRIEGNLIEESNPTPGCWGLMVDAAGTTIEGHTNAVIRGNVVRNVGNQSIGVSACVDCLIENNLVIQTLIGGSTGIASPNRATTAPDADVTGTVVRNNTVYFGGSASGRAYYVGERGSHYVVANNIGYFANPKVGDVCFNFDLAAGAYDLVNSNLCFGALFDSGTTGMDGMASTADPLFLNPPDDLRPDVGSPARNSGTSVSASATDILGNVRDGTPDRGAYEVQ